MLASLVVAALIGQEAPAPTAGKLITDMLAHYAQAKTLVGNIVLDQAIGSHELVVRTDLQYERETSKLSVVQKITKPQGRTTFAVCDGSQIYYTPPKIAGNWEHVKGLTEPVNAGTKVKSFDELYAIAASGMVDRSTPLSVAFGRKEDLRIVLDQWASYKLDGEVTVRDTKAYHIVGDWRPYGLANIAGTYELFVTESGDMLKFVRHERLTPPGSNASMAMETTYDVDLKVNGTVDPKVFEIKM